MKKKQEAAQAPSTGGLCAVVDAPLCIVAGAETTTDACAEAPATGSAAGLCVVTGEESDAAVLHILATELCNKPAIYPEASEEPTIKECIERYFADCERRGVRCLPYMMRYWSSRGAGSKIDDKPLEDCRPSELTSAALKRWLEAVAAAASPHYATKLRNILSAAVQLAARTSEAVAQMPVLPTERLPGQSYKPRSSTIPLDRVGRVARLLWASANESDSGLAADGVRAFSRVMLWHLLILCTGLRGDDLRMVRIGDVVDAVVDGEQVKALRLTRGENGAAYTVPLYGIAKLCIERMLELHAGKPKPTSYLWRTTTDQKPIDTRMLGIVWRLFVKKHISTEDSVTVHDLRRTAAALLLSDGADHLMADLLLKPGGRRRTAAHDAYYVVQTATLAPVYRRLAGIVGRLMAAEDYTSLPDRVKQASLFEAGLSGTKEEPRA